MGAFAISAALYQSLRTGQGLTTESVERSISLMLSGSRPSDVLTANILSNRGRTIRPKTLNQKNYVDAIDAMQRSLAALRSGR